ncbi:uncharacterized protein LOC111047947 [Nilaparvata lugens]|uniref:uncharacterized protein LOC111047947 n=1 Tax=Nilaparvata lugens TaxID=108931 RepID=UPI00193DD9E0|nr:uncharacterized protein LOC111047947 [Nilaparvata lugens]
MDKPSESTKPSSSQKAVKMETDDNEADDVINRASPTATNGSSSQRGDMEFRVGQKVEVRDYRSDMTKWYTAKIMEVDYEEREILIHYEKFSQRYDEWMNWDSQHIRRISQSADSHQIRRSANQAVSSSRFKIGESVMATWNYTKKYLAVIQKILPDDKYEVKFYDGFVKVLRGNRITELNPNTAQSIMSKMPEEKPPAPRVGSELDVRNIGTKAERREKKRRINVAEIFHPPSGAAAAAKRRKLDEGEGRGGGGAEVKRRRRRRGKAVKEETQTSVTAAAAAASLKEPTVRKRRSSRYKEEPKIEKEADKDERKSEVKEIKEKAKVTVKIEPVLEEGKSTVQQVNREKISVVATLKEAIIKVEKVQPTEKRQSIDETKANDEKDLITATNQPNPVLPKQESAVPVTSSEGGGVSCENGPQEAKKTVKDVKLKDILPQVSLSRTSALRRVRVPKLRPSVSALTSSSFPKVKLEPIDSRSHNVSLTSRGGRVIKKRVPGRGFDESEVTESISKPGAPESIKEEKDQEASLSKIPKITSAVEKPANKAEGDVKEAAASLDAKPSAGESDKYQVKEERVREGGERVRRRSKKKKGKRVRHGRKHKSEDNGGQEVKDWRQDRHRRAKADDEDDPERWSGDVPDGAQPVFIDGGDGKMRQSIIIPDSKLPAGWTKHTIIRKNSSKWDVLLVKALDDDIGKMRQSIIIPDSKLPAGWTKHTIIRKNSSKWDVLLVNQNGRKFRSRKDLRVYYNEMNKAYPEDRFDFVIGRSKTTAGLIEQATKSNLQQASSTSASTSTSTSTVTSTSSRHLHRSGKKSSSKETPSSSSPISGPAATPAPTVTEEKKIKTLLPKSKPANLPDEMVVASPVLPTAAAAASAGQPAASAAKAVGQPASAAKGSVATPKSAGQPVSAAKGSVATPKSVGQPASAAKGSVATPKAVGQPASAAKGSVATPKAVGQPATAAKGGVATPKAVGQPASVTKSAASTPKVDAATALLATQVSTPPVEEGTGSVQCPKDGCGKNFRKESLLQMHIKHYHPEYSGFLDGALNVADLAYARTVGEQLDGGEGGTDDEHQSSSFLERITRYEQSCRAKATRVHSRSAGKGVKEGGAGTGGSRRRSAGGVGVQSPLRKALMKGLTFSPERLAEDHVDSNKKSASHLSAPGTPTGQGRPESSPMETDSEWKTSTESNERLKPEELEKLGADSRQTTGKDSHVGSRTPPPRQKYHSEGTSDLPRTPSSASYHYARNKPCLVSLEKLNLTPDSNGRVLLDKKGQCNLKLEKSDSNVDGVDGPADGINTTDTVEVEVINKKEEIINCMCGYTEEDGLMIQCDLCLCWQHGLCNNISTDSEVPEKYICYICLHSKHSRSSRKYMHNQDWLKEGKLPILSFRQHDDQELQKKETILKRSHELVSSLLQLQTVVKSLRLKTHIAGKSDHPKLYLWSKSWDRDEKDKQEIKMEEKGTNDDNKEEDIKKEESDMLQKVANIPVPEAPIDLVECRLRLLDHIENYQQQIDDRLSSLDAQVSALEAMDPDLTDDETADYYPRSKQTVQMLLNDLGTLRKVTTFN